MHNRTLQLLSSRTLFRPFGQTLSGTSRASVSQPARRLLSITHEHGNHGRSGRLCNLKFISPSLTVRNVSRDIDKDKTPVGKFEKDLRTTEDNVEAGAEANEEDGEPDPYAPFPDNTNPITGEIGGPKGPEPTRYGDWERKGRVTDF